MSVHDIAATPSQRARRERILGAALELALDGYDAVQMREVAEKADVALGTLYRYFPSKVHLLVAAMAETLELLRDRASKRPVASVAPVDRVMHVITWVTDYLGQNRNLSGALVRALMFADGSVADDVNRVAQTMTSIIATATHGTDQPPTEQDTLAALILGKVWLSDIVSWLGERMTLEEMLASMRATAEVVLPA